MIKHSKITGYIILSLSVILFVIVVILPSGLLSLAATADGEQASENAVTSRETLDTDDMTAGEIKQMIEDLENSLVEIENSKTELHKKLDEVLAHKDELESAYLADKLVADAEIQLIELRIDVYNDIIAKYDVLMSAKQAEIESAKQSFDDIYAVFSERLRQSYEEGLPGALEIFFNSETFVEMLTSIERMSDILEYDQTTMRELELLVEKKNAELAELEVYKNEQQKVLVLLDAEKKELDEQLEASLAAIDIENTNIDEFILMLQISEQEEELMNYQLNQAINDYYEHLEGDELKAYEMTEDYKRFFVLPEIVERMESGEIMKGSEYFEDGQEYIWPLPASIYLKKTISSTYGMRTYTNSSGEKVTGYHHGYDLRAPKDTEIYACKTGVVVTATYNSSYGYYVDILHEDGSITRYAHCCKILVSVGEFVLQGETIALVGSTGNSTGNHLHVEVLINRTSVNPNKYIVMPSSN